MSAEDVVVVGLDVRAAGEQGWSLVAATALLQAKSESSLQVLFKCELILYTTSIFF